MAMRSRSVASGRGRRHGGARHPPWTDGPASRGTYHAPQGQVGRGRVSGPAGDAGLPRSCARGGGPRSVMACGPPLSNGDAPGRGAVDPRPPSGDGPAGPSAPTFGPGQGTSVAPGGPPTGRRGDRRPDTQPTVLSALACSPAYDRGSAAVSDCQRRAARAARAVAPFCSKQATASRIAADPATRSPQAHSASASTLSARPRPRALPPRGCTGCPPARR